MDICFMGPDGPVDFTEQPDDLCSQTVREIAKKMQAQMTPEAQALIDTGKWKMEYTSTEEVVGDTCRINITGELVPVPPSCDD